MGPRRAPACGVVNAGDVVVVDLGRPVGREAGFRRPAVVATHGALLRRAVEVVHVVPLTTSRRDWVSHVPVTAESSTGLAEASDAQCHLVRAVDRRRVEAVLGRVDTSTLDAIRAVVGDVLDVPSPFVDR